MTGAEADCTRLAMPAHDLTLPPPRPEQGYTVVGPAMARAQKFVGLVRTEGTDAIGAYLDLLTTDQHYALTVTLAAMVPDDVPVSELLHWVTDDPNQPALTLKAETP